jgi:uncharacterized protein
MQIPNYPDSRPLELTDKSRFDSALAADPPEISEFTFTNIYSWRRAYAFRVSLAGDFLILSAEKKGKRSFFRPIGPGDFSEPVKLIARERIPFIRIPEKDTQAVAAASGFRMELDRDNADYLYSTRELIELRGKKFDGKRNLIKKFKRTYTYEYAKLDGNTSRDCLDFHDFWCMTKECASEESLMEEQQAVQEMCHNFFGFGLSGGSIRVGGKTVAVAIGQQLNPSTMVMHVLKALPEMPGLYQAMHNEFLAHEASGFPYVNMEQDLGIAGLRKSKLSYQPVQLINKYRLLPQ